MIRKSHASDAPFVAAIYNHYVTSSIVTFELEPVTDDEMRNRMDAIAINYPYLVYEEDGVVLGYAYATQWKARQAYQHSVESSVYLHHDAIGKGIGSMLYAMLLDKFKEMSIHAVIGGISLPNEASIALHEKFGFEKIGQFKQVGRKFNRWIDVGYWELILSK
ncbi:N-acetyltransferase [Carboxylicivirga mesophila]|uniref:N-acetyltransferase n=1 Tax=Carboxylicivirga mesophila TaxID=1166478 RepID=A0ABS5K5F9_9BACT|nr:arsinothricin resistance N-acetyltransferase ArsN1 family B [Carboxylicivirga mesophila]MBS2209783.1 N-acetyltransferase [Carboxylicivirga mesophila]